MTRELAKAALVFTASGACAGTSSRVPPAAMPADGARSAPVRQIEIISEQLQSGYRVVLARTPPVPGREPRIYIGSPNVVILPHS